MPDSAGLFNPGAGDDFFVYLPDRIAALNEWKGGRVPLWNPYVSGGTSFLGMQTANPVDPLIVLELLLPMGQALGLTYALLFFVAGFGLVLYLRDRGLDNRVGLTIAAVSFALCPYFILWLETRVFLAGLAGLPLALWAMERLVSHRARRRREAGILTLVVGYAALAGTLQTLAIVLLVISVRLLWLTFGLSGNPAGKSLDRPLIFTAIAAGLAIGILPLIAGIEMLSHSTRLGPEGYYAGRNFLHWRSVALWFSPDVFAFPAQGRFAAFKELGRNYMFGSGWGATGIVPLGLAAFAVHRRAVPRPELLFWGGLSLLTLGFLALQATPIHQVLLRFLPWLDDVDLIRGLIVFNLGIAILAGWGAMALARTWSERREPGERIIFFLFLVGTGVAAIGFGRTGIEVPHSLPRDLLYLVIIVGIFFLVDAVPLGHRPRPGLRAVLLVLLAASELLWLHFKLNTFATADTVFPRNELAGHMKSLLESGDHPRYVTKGRLRLFPPNTGSVYGLSDVRGYSNIPVARYRSLLESAELHENLRNNPVVANVDSPIYDLLGVRYVLAPSSPGHPYKAVWPWAVYDRPQSLPRAFIAHKAIVLANEADMRWALSDPRFDPRSAVLVESTDRPALTAPQNGPDEVRITEWAADRTRIRARASARGILVLADPYFPGWSATVDGRKTAIFPVYRGLRGIGIDRGVHEVEFVYRPWWLVPGGFLMATGIILAVAWCLRPEGPHRRAPQRRSHRRQPAIDGVAVASRRRERIV